MSAVSSPLLDRRYRILADIGGFPGERHYAARHVELDVPVRLVTLRTAERRAMPKDGATDPFRRHATAAIALRHPGVVRVRDCFQQGARIAVVLDWTPTETLAAQLAARCRLSLRETLALGLHLCDTLSGIARQAPMLLPLGTFTPESLAILPDGKCVLTDLAIRTWLDGRRSASLHTAYRAPEALAGEPEDVRSDLYSIAAILHTALVGTPPSACSAGRLPLSVLLPWAPPSVRATLERALRTDSDERYGSPEEFGEALAATVRQTLPDVVTPQIPSRPLEHRSRRNHTHPSGRSWHGSRGADEPVTTSHGWPLVGKPELARAATPLPFRRTGGRAIAAISSALRLGA